LLAPVLDERRLRLYVGAEALALGYGGRAVGAQATGVSRPTITAGCKELLAAGQRRPPQETSGRIRNPGAGRKRTSETDATLRTDLERLIEPVTRGDPASPLRWTSKSVRQLADERQRMGHQTSHRLVAAWLHEMDYSLQANRKTLEGSAHPDREAQFGHIHRQVKAFQAAAQPGISVDTNKKAWVGNVKHQARELRPKGAPERVRVHDVEIPALGKVAPYGVYDPTQHTGWVHVGTDHDTAAFAVASIRRWWHLMGQQTYPHAQRVLITADSGGRHGDRTRLWKTELQQLAHETGLEMTVGHLPPGTSKWHKIDHRLFSYISQHWRGKPLVSHQVSVHLSAATTTRTGLTVRGELETNTYPKGINITDNVFKQVNSSRDAFHGEWNYTITPNAS
jgi:transposase